MGGASQIVAVDLGGTWVRVASFESGGTIRSRARAATLREAGPEAVVAQICSLVREVVASGPRLAGPEVVVAIAVPGPVDPLAGVMDGAPNLPGWRMVPLRALVEAQLGCRCLIDHDASLAALGEHRRGAGRGVADFVYITVSTGIGAGLIFDHHLYRGGSGRAGEFGHVVVVEDGPLCHCGNRGCLEAVASGTAIAQAAGASSAAEVARLAAAGDPTGQRVLAAAARHLGLAVGGLINLLNPDLIAFGGGVMGAGGGFWDGMVVAVAEGSFAATRAHCRLERTQLGEDQGLLGAYELARDELAR
ncbi:MAG: ROK family protein [Candidatus Dormibacteria bacterium]